MADEKDLEAPDLNVELMDYAEKAYLDYAMSVVLGRALPMLPDGQKPVQRRILYDMHRMGLTDKSKHIKSARVVGDVLGKYHAHGDSSVYDATVRMSQSFALRYPVVDGQGNFGDRDGSGAAAMRYTEIRITPIAELLLGELDMGTVDFVPNYDGTLQEPALLPARLPMLLLNGASGIAVALATEIPSHNLVEVANACEMLIKNPEATLADVMEHIPGPDFPCGAQIISSKDDIVKAYSTGRGSLRTRARWVVEPLARGQWQIAVTELPPGTSTAKVMLEIDAVSNPQIKAGKKTLTQEQSNLKALVLSLVDRISDDSDEAHPVRIIIEPKSSRLAPDDVMQVLLAHTSLEYNVPINMVTIGQDKKPQQKGLLQILTEWVAFRFETVVRRTQFRLGQIRSRMHILQGRLTVFLHIDEVIQIIRAVKDPKAELMEKFSLSDIQAMDILEIRLRQLATLERLKLEGELLDLEMEEGVLQNLLDNRKALTKQILKEIDADRKKYGDERRTLVEAAAKITTTSVVATSDEPLTVIVSQQGWLRARTGHKLDASALTWKTGDAARTVLEVRSNQAIVFFDNTGRAYNIAASAFPPGRGDGAPASSFVDMGANSIAHVFALDESASYLLSTTGGYGFIAPGIELLTRQKAGKVVMTGLGVDELILPPVLLSQVFETGEVVVAANTGKVLVCPLTDMKVMAKGRGVQLMGLNTNDTLVAVHAQGLPYTGLALTTLPYGPKKLTEMYVKDAATHRGRRARSGVALAYKAVALSISNAMEAPVARGPAKSEEDVNG